MPRPKKKKAPPKMKGVYYARSFPFGAPLVRLFGSGTYELREFLKDEGFRWNPDAHAWESYKAREALGELLSYIRDGYEIPVAPTKNLPESYQLDLDAPNYKSPGQDLTPEEKAAKVENAR